MTGSQFRAALAVALILFTTPVCAQQTANVLVNVIFHDASGRILVNGVPIRAFATDPRARTPGEPPLVESLVHWLNNGDNSVVVESRPRSRQGFSEVRILRTNNEPEILRKRIAETGTAERSFKVEGQPRWAWQDSQVWTGDPQAVVAATRDLYDTLARKNTAAFDASRKALERDMSRIYGAITPAQRRDMHGFILQARLVPLTVSDLTVTAHYGNRLFVVSRPDGTAPIKVYTGSERSPQNLMETGQFWVRENNTWQVVR